MNAPVADTAEVPAISLMETAALRIGPFLEVDVPAQPSRRSTLTQRRHERRARRQLATVSFLFLFVCLGITVVVLGAAR